jgi:hypothetical protein
MKETHSVEKVITYHFGEGQDYVVLAHYLNEQDRQARRPHHWIVLDANGEPQDQKFNVVPTWDDVYDIYTS